MARITLSQLQQHRMWSRDDYSYFAAKGYTNREIKDFWDRDLKWSKGPCRWDTSATAQGKFRSVTSTAPAGH